MGAGSIGFRASIGRMVLMQARLSEHNKFLVADAVGRHQRDPHIYRNLIATLSPYSAGRRDLAGSRHSARYGPTCPNWIGSKVTSPVDPFAPNLVGGALNVTWWRSYPFTA